jgi:hypothetical protein
MINKNIFFSQLFIKCKTHSTQKALEKNLGQRLRRSVHFYIQGGATLTIFAISRFLIIEKNLRMARKRHTLWSYKPVPLFYLLSIGFRVKRR